MSKSVEVVQLEPIALRPKQASQLIGVSLRKLAEMRSCGLLPPAYKLGGCLVYRTSDLKQWSAWGFPSLDKFLALQKGDKK